MLKKKTYVYILLGIFLLSLIPIYLVGFHAHPSVDDYYYGVETAKVWQDTGSMKSVIKESFDQMITTYKDWQGNFSAIFLMRLQPGIFGESSYFIAPLILITSFLIAMLAFFYTFLRRWFRAGKIACIGSAICITFCALQFTYVPSDSFYWYNGSIYYTFFFSLMLILFTLLTLMIKSTKTPVRIVTFIFSILLAFVIGGGNYSTALFTCIILVLAVLWHLIHKRKITIPIAGIALAGILGLLISVIAPGNAIRQESVGGSTGVIKALLYSFAYGGYNIASSTTAPVVILWIALIPVFYRIAKHSGYKFRHPILVLLFTFGVFCSQGTPLFYAQGLRMPYRMMNIIYFNYYFFMTFNLIYIMGYIANRFGECKFSKIVENITSGRKVTAVYALVTVILFSICSIGLCKVSESESGSADFTGLPLSASAAYSIVNGDAKTYDNELDARAEFLRTTDEQEVVLKPLTVTPAPIFHTDISTNPSFWKNGHLALYYNKISVELSE